MDLLEHRARLARLIVSGALGAASGVAVVRGFAEVLDHDSSSAPTWFAVFTVVMVLVLVAMGTNAALAAWARRRWHLPIPAARVVRR